MMNAENIAKADMLDIVFDGRNKSYGAYQLRRSYSKRLSKAMGAVMLLTALGFVTSMLANNGKNEIGAVIKTDTLTLQIYEEPVKPLEPPPLVETPPPAQDLATIKVTIPAIVPDKDFREEDAPPENAEIVDAKIGLVNLEGTPDEGIVAPPVLENKGTGLSVAPVKRAEDNVDEVHYIVQNPAEFPGGLAAWKRYLERNLVYPEDAVENGKEAAVRVQFIVNREGVISDVKALDDPGFGLAEEAVRIIKKGPNWKPAEQNGRKVIYRHIQNITFRLSN